MATAKINTEQKKYMVTTTYVYNNKSFGSGECIVLDHPPSSEDINDFIDANGYSDEEVIVVELGRVGTLTREVTITF